MVRAGTVHFNHYYDYLTLDRNLTSIRLRSNIPRYHGSTRYRPLHDRLNLYSLVTNLRANGHSYRQIREKILVTTSIRLSKASISDWTRGTHHPLGGVNTFNPEPRPQLAYIIGTVLSDGNLNVHGYHREMLLSVTDQDFAQEFSRCLAKILGRARHYAVRWSEKRQRWIVQGRSMLLYNFLKRDWRELTKSIEHCENCTSSFLRAFYDGEGSVTGPGVIVSNNNEALLKYVQRLLARLNIDTGSLIVGTRAGTRLHDPRTGKTYFTKKDCFCFHVRARSIRMFAEKVGFTIVRKSERLRKLARQKSI
jgi:intein-encoded DNA endonuclease-like protein